MTTLPNPKCPQLFAVPAGTPLRPCRSCNAPAYWIRTAGKGRPMLVDCHTKDYPGCGLQVPTESLAGVGVSHFVTCPQRDTWRKKAAEKKADEE